MNALEVERFLRAWNAYTYRAGTVNIINNSQCQYLSTLLAGYNWIACLHCGRDKRCLARHTVMRRCHVVVAHTVTP